ncbi:MAG: HEPN domain-containing protein [Deltaproteobacteria bacterium]|nr:HEPN domain-containing protein [Deltaproteobacteria bacterium]
MTGENREFALEEEFARSAEDLAAARALVAAGLYRPAMTRAYYAAFHAVRALLFAEGLEPRSHGGTQHLLNLHYIRPGRLEPRWNRVLARLQRFREEADYGGAFVLDREALDEELLAAEALCARARELLGRPAAR